MAVYGKPQIKKPKTGINVYEDGSYGKPYKDEKANDNSSPGVRQFQREIKVRAEKRDMKSYKVDAMKEKLAKKKMQ
jgi:hypothetical protein